MLSVSIDRFRGRIGTVAAGVLMMFSYLPTGDGETLNQQLFPSSASTASTTENGPPHQTLFNASVSYELASTGESENDFISVRALDVRAHSHEMPYFTQDSVRETAALANFVVGLRMATGIYFADLISFCDEEAAQADISCPPDLDMPCEDYIEQQRQYIRLRCLGEPGVAPDIDGGLNVMDDLVTFLESENIELGNEALESEIQLANEIRDNMAEGGPAPIYRDEGVDNPWSNPGGGGGAGATPGGAQDFGYVREVVDEGYVPLPDHLDAAGLFSEHDLPIESDIPCEHLLCIRTALGLAPDFETGGISHYAQIGFSSGIDLDTFERSPLNLVIVLDKSGSMHDPADENVTKIEAVKHALTLMVDKLNGEDRLAIVIFDSGAHVLLESTPVTDPEGIKALIASISAGGGTNIEEGLSEGFLIAAANSAQDERLDRVMLLTDALPNVGVIGESAFVTMTREYADQGIGLSTFGVGFNFGQELVLEISSIRGGNYFFLEDADRIEEVFTVDFDYLVTPLAYGFWLQLAPGSAFETQDAHGVSMKDGEVAELETATIFLSRNRGAILLRLTFIPPVPIERSAEES